MGVVSERGRVIVITGAMAAGKSTVAELLAQRLPRSVHVRGDLFRRLVVNGRADLTPAGEAAALEQLHLRYDLACHAADAYAAHGFDVIVQDVIVGHELAGFVDRIGTRDRFLVVLSPTVSALEARELGRTKRGYTYFSPAQLDEILRRETARIGYWLDSSAQSPEATVDDILAHLERARV